MTDILIQPQPQPQAQAQNPKKRERKNNYQSDIVYSKSMITRNITLLMNDVGKNIFQILEKNIALMFEGKCIVEGFVKPQSCKLITYSSGIVKSASIQFEVVFQCDICCPVEGMIIQCVAKNITQAGIRAESSEEKPSPVLVFITRDHHYMSKYFSSIKENDTFMARVIGQRFELNDKYVSIIAELVEPSSSASVIKPKLIIGEKTT